MNKSPDNIWIDPRVLKTMATERDPSYHADQVQYIRADIVKDKVDKARNQIIDTIPEEFVISIQTVSLQTVSLQAGELKVDSVLALTNLGRIFQEERPGVWVKYRGPEFPKIQSFSP